MKLDRSRVVIRKDSEFSWTVLVDGRETVQRESFQVASNVAECIVNESYGLFTECREVADSILAHLAK